jgi:hypothetical protein
MLADVRPGPASSNGFRSRAHLVVGGSAFFDGYDGQNPQGYWRTDGTAAGTRAVNLGTGLVQFLGSDAEWLYTWSDGAVRAYHPVSNVSRPLLEGSSSEFFFGNGRAFGIAYGEAGDDGIVSPSRLTLFDPTRGTIAGNVFADIAGDGVRNAGDDMVSGFRVFLDRNGDGWWNRNEPFARTDDVGLYTLSNLPAGQYWLRVTHVDGWRFTTNDALRVHVTPGGEVIRHFGVTRDIGTIAGSVFNDLNGDGTRSEPGVEGFRVFLDVDNDGGWDKGEPFSFSTGENGWYEFPEVSAGKHWLRVSSGKGWRETTSIGYRVTVDAGAIVIRHFGATRNVLILGSVFVDANLSGGKDAGEAALAGWTVFADEDRDGVLDPDEVRVRTDAAGRYAIRTLAGGPHRMRVVGDTAYRMTAPGAGYRDVSLLPGAVVTGVNFGQERIA